MEHYRDVFAELPGKARNYVCELKVREHSPYMQRSYPVPFSKRRAVQEELDRMMEGDIIAVSYTHLFLNRTREFNRFNNSRWEIKLLKILKCFKGNSEIWAEVHNTEWGSYEDFEVAFRNKYWSEEGQEILRSKIM